MIADRAVIAINTVVADYNSYNGTTLTFTVLLYALQLYTDFSGGIDISRGIAQILGIDMTENFRRPYFSKTINEYWRRWHITLGAWMKEYIFYPLSLSNAFLTASKKMKGTKFGATKAGAHIAKVLPTACASLIVFLVVGVWHGASWKYVAFGLWNGGVIMLSILMKPLFDGAIKKLHINPQNFFWKLFQILRTFIIVCIGYVFDIAPSFRQAMLSFKRMMIMPLSGIHQILDLGLTKGDYLTIALGGIIIFVVSILNEGSKENLRIRIDRKPVMLEWAIVLVGILVIITFGVYGPGYNASDFVYAQF